MPSFSIEKKTVDVFPGTGRNQPVIYLNTYGREGEQVFRYLQKSNCPDFSLVAVRGLDWQRDLVPRNAPALSKNQLPFVAGADEYLSLLIEKMIPESEKLLQGSPCWRGIAGYSLAGLFSLYASLHTDLFSRIACMSASFWFPGVLENVFSQTPFHKPDCIYFSLGDREHKTRNQMMCSVRKNTDQICDFYQKQGVNTTFQLFPGGHFQNTVERTAAGLRWILER